MVNNGLMKILLKIHKFSLFKKGNHFNSKIMLASKCSVKNNNKNKLIKSISPLIHMRIISQNYKKK